MVSFSIIENILPLHISFGDALSHIILLVRYNAQPNMDTHYS